ncbi:hypothetical protein V6N11_028530 [Hibiscus sabdariffa]|uniref:Uncharacterized protein n=1 Tax=Hibiscus sabdariffa TaxID=183260 RepID=A0ABR2NEQ9_9ROSI
MGFFLVVLYIHRIRTPETERVKRESDYGGGTNRSDKGLNLRVDRGSKATLPLTIPRRVFKSSAKDSTRRSVEITLQGGTHDLSDARATPTTRALGGQRPLLRVGNRATGACVASSPDSDLEAFSHNPAHGSFAPLAFQPNAMTNRANQRFLSY